MQRLMKINTNTFFISSASIFFNYVLFNLIGDNFSFSIKLPFCFRRSPEPFPIPIFFMPYNKLFNAYVKQT